MQSRNLTYLFDCLLCFYKLFSSKRNPSYSQTVLLQTGMQLRPATNQVFYNQCLRVKIA